MAVARSNVKTYARRAREPRRSTLSHKSPEPAPRIRLTYPKRKRQHSRAASSSLSSLPGSEDDDNVPNIMPSRSSPSRSTLFKSSFSTALPSSSQQSNSSVSSFLTRLFPSQRPTSAVSSQSAIVDEWDIKEIVKPHQPVFVRLEPKRSPVISENGTVMWPATVSHTRVDVNPRSWLADNTIIPTSRSLWTLIRPL